MAGDGYRGRMSPHTPNEKFEGATVLKTLQVHSPLKMDFPFLIETCRFQHSEPKSMIIISCDNLHGAFLDYWFDCTCVSVQFGYEGRVPMGSARLFYDVSERARRVIESYFLLNSTLHFSYTHLVCRTAITGALRDPGSTNARLG